MAKKPQQNPADIAKAAGKLAELKTRLLFLVGALIVFRVGTFIPVPGVDPVALKDFFDQQSGNLLGLFNLFSGGALSRFGLFALGIMPYISSSIIMQMASHIVPSLQQLRKEGEQGRRQIIKYTRWGTVALASFQSVAAASWLQNQAGLVVNPGPRLAPIVCNARCTAFGSADWPKNCAIVAGNIRIDDAKIGGMTPDMLILNGRCVLCAAYILRPCCRRA